MLKHAVTMISASPMSTARITLVNSAPTYPVLPGSVD